MKSVCVCCVLLVLGVLGQASATAVWKTLSRSAPLVIANGGTSGLYPDQTEVAYVDALNYSVPGVVLMCDVQFTQDRHGICRTYIDLQQSTNIKETLQDKSNTYNFYGVETNAWFSIDFDFTTIDHYARSIQSNTARSPIYDGQFTVLRVEEVQEVMKKIGILGQFWINCEYPLFFEQQNVNVSDYLISAIKVLSPMFMSSPEIKILKTIQPSAAENGTKIIFKFQDSQNIEPTTNQTYGDLLKNLSSIATFASGILVPKDYIWPVNSKYYLMPHTSLVQDAHKTNLEVYAYGFANDEYPSAWNYSYNPVDEYLGFISSSDFSVDGVVSDFPTTASEAISCYQSGSESKNSSTELDNASLRLKTPVMSHNGDSGNYPGCTTLAYDSAVRAGVDYIDCPVQMTSDGVPICRESADLVVSTTVSSTSFLQNIATYPEVQPGGGVFTFDLTWADINSSLQAIMYSPGAISNVTRNNGYNGQPILRLEDFLNYAKKQSNVGIVIYIQHAEFLRTQKSISAVDAVVAVLSNAGFNGSEKVIMESSESSSLKRLTSLSINYPFAYVIPYDKSNPISVSDSALAEIKQFASSVVIPTRLVEPLDNLSYFLLNPTSVVSRAHAQNLTVYYSFLRNEFISLPFDYRSDPLLQMSTLLNYYKVDGLITDFPATTLSYLGSECFQGYASNGANFTPPLVVPGVLIAAIPGYTPDNPPAAPDLQVAEPPLAGLVPISNTPGSAPGPAPSAAPYMCRSILLSALLSVIVHLLVLS